MEIQFYGANCVRITAKKASIVIDDNLAELGQKAVTKPGDIILQTYGQPEPVVESNIVINMPGEYEVSDISIQGVAARAHMDEDGKMSATMFKVVIDDIRLVVVGHVYPELSEAQLESIGVVDILLIPVGNSGYTLDSLGALKLIKKIDPKLVIPTHYADKALNYEVPQQSLEEAIKGIVMEVKETLPKLKLKGHIFSDIMQLIVLERQ